MEEYVTPEEVAKYWEVFRIFEVGGSGYITAKGLFSLMEIFDVKVSENTLLQMIKANNNGAETMNFEEFVAMIMRKRAHYSGQALHRCVFGIFKDECSRISLGRFRMLLNTLGVDISDETIDEVIKSNNVRGDGSLAYDEFLRMVNGNKK
ncbi:Calmodulin [Zancudomyces culisetae]|uniref:Calmodulin n=1 Tax=Zancudomyces culisetae TaxID=1213189 RepID=A0A1R1PZN1_ZANCU|nr:Calmodulin [Zancudomyces culisetae]|eukprot:OMH86421.1 Calmodulin [Zancudomyces culisetae]